MPLYTPYTAQTVLGHHYALQEMFDRINVPVGLNWRHIQAQGVLLASQHHSWARQSSRPRVLTGEYTWRQGLETNEVILLSTNPWCAPLSAEDAHRLAQKALFNDQSDDPKWTLVFRSTPDCTNNWLLKGAFQNHIFQVVQGWLDTAKNKDAEDLRALDEARQRREAAKKNTATLLDLLYAD